MDLIPYLKLVFGLLLSGIVFFILDKCTPWLRDIFEITDPELGVLFFLFGLLPAIIFFGSGLKTIMTERKRGI